jgi:hypothetical protein
MTHSKGLEISIIVFVEDALETRTSKEVCHGGRLTGAQAHSRIATLTPTMNGNKLGKPLLLWCGIILYIEQGCASFQANTAGSQLGSRTRSNTTT